VKSSYVALALALMSGVLYSSLLPLWNGFDEPFHYSYIETLVLSHTFPKLRHTPITTEIKDSIALVEVSRFLQEMVPGSISVEQWSQLPRIEKQRRRSQLTVLSPRLRSQPSDLLNYEAQQAPFAYMMAAPVDALLSGRPLTARVFTLRLFLSTISALMLYFGGRRLGGALDVNPSFAVPALFCACLTQTLWAAVAHVSNDALAVPLTVWFLGSLACIVKQGNNPRREVILLASVLAIGLVTKAYFVAFVPVFAGVLAMGRVRKALTPLTCITLLSLLLVIAGPWYFRNLLLYRSVSGTQESTSIGVGQALAAIPHIDWVAGALQLARWSLWTGDWSFVSFSQPTLNTELLVIAAGVASFVFRGCRNSQAGRWVVIACGCFLAGLIYQTCVTWVSSNGASKFAEPWYGQGVVFCVWVLAFKGFEFIGLFGRILAMLACLLSAWIALLTYLAKLPIFYVSGTSRLTVRTFLSLWSVGTQAELAGVILGPRWIFYPALVAFVLLVLGGGFLVIRGLLNRNNVSHSNSKTPIGGGSFATVR
jgi:hypothetical protein